MLRKRQDREAEGLSITDGTPSGAGPGTRERIRGGLKKLLQGKKRKVIALVLVASIAGGVVVWRGHGQTAAAATEYQEAEVERRSITNSLSASGTLEPADSYTVNTLVSGEILSDTFEKGDQVEEGQLLYTIDSSNASSSLTQSQNSYSQAQTSYQQAVDAKYPEADLSGTVSEVYVNEGDSVSAGTELLKIVADENMYIDFSFTYADSDDFYIGQSATVFIDGFAGTLTGTVTAVSSSSAAVSTGVPLTTVRVRLTNPGLVTTDYTASAVIGSYSSYGQSPVSMPASSIVYAAGSGTVNDFTKLAGSTVTKGETLCTVESETIRDQIENARLSLQSAQLSASTAADSVDDYNIKSPISGTVIEKNFKAGDKVDGASSGTLAVIYDLSYLKLEMAVAELDIGKVEVGQRVEITADALEGQTFEGVVDKVSINGTTTNGFTNYPVTIIIEDYGDLKPGMNVSAEIIGEEIPNALCIPVDAVDRGNTVTVPGPGALNEDGTAVVDITKLETKEVTLGRSDDEYVEVTGGLEAGDVVLIRNQASTLMDMMMGG